MAQKKSYGARNTSGHMVRLSKLFYLEPKAKDFPPKFSANFNQIARKTAKSNVRHFQVLKM